MTGLSETKAILSHLIGFPTVSSESNLDLISYAANRLEAIGARIDLTSDKTGSKGNLFASFGPYVSGGIVLSGHTDVVPAFADEWTSDPFVAREEGDLIFGRGACDMKGFIAAVLAKAPELAARALKRPLHIALTFDEEIGCFGAQRLVARLQELDTLPSMVIIGEPTMMGVVEGHKGCCEYMTRFRGMEGHGSGPDKGVNAVHYASRYVGRLLELGDQLKARGQMETRFDPPHTTVQVGRMQGGVARNVIAGYCEVEWEVRPVRMGDENHVKNELAFYCEEVLLPAMRSVSPDATIDLEIIAEVPGLEPVSENEARQILQELTGRNTAEVVPFGTEAGLFQSMGMSVAVCGPGSIDQAHKPDEFVSLEQLSACLTMLEGLGGKLDGLGTGA